MLFLKYTFVFTMTIDKVNDRIGFISQGRQLEWLAIGSSGISVRRNGHPIDPNRPFVSQTSWMAHGEHRMQGIGLDDVNVTVRITKTFCSFR